MNYNYTTVSFLGLVNSLLMPEHTCWYYSTAIDYLLYVLYSENYFTSHNYHCSVCDCGMLW